ncbi:MAG: HAMP domain-containing histidine kinase [Bacteroidetes bacterium]|nr:MAG: HAMP domain-containing histidine kinase [Bacteroidota bacterium]
MNVNERGSFLQISYIRTMKLRKRTFALLVAALVISLGGLVSLQYVLLSDAIKQKEQTFRQNVFSAMTMVAERLEKLETAGKVFKVIVSSSSDVPMRFVHVDVDTTIEKKLMPDSVIRNAGIRMERPPVWFSNDSIRYSLEKPGRVLLRVYDAVGREDSVLVDSFMNAGVYSRWIKRAKYSQGEFFYKLNVDSLTYTMRVANGVSEGIFPPDVMFEQKKQLVGRVIEDLSVSEREPIERRIRPEVLDSLIGLSLKEAGIALPYEFGVLDGRNDSLKIVQPASYSPRLRSSEFKNRLFPGDFLFSGNQLLLYFPDQQMFLLRQIGFQVALTILLTSLLVFCFVYAVRTIIKQKEFAVRLVEFINNMTHEFKTPISTISVATETILRSDVIEQKEKVLRYGSVIRDENQRMKTQVDKILQMAVLEEGEFELKIAKVDVHEVIARAVETIALQIEAKQGTLRYEFEAEQSTIDADVVHLTNMIYNVLDNANKYSPEQPEICISTKNSGRMLLVQVADKGIGIGKHEVSKVFDKYYRVPTGNRHDVKGFGLGLSYVSLMMKAHNGEASVASEPGKGTTITLSFPVSNGATE